MLQCGLLHSKYNKQNIPYFGPKFKKHLSKLSLKGSNVIEAAQTNVADIGKKPSPCMRHLSFTIT